MGRATKLVAVVALVGAPTFVLLSQSPAGASASVGSVTVFGSDVTNPIGGANCAAGNPVSLGDNYTDDDSCNFVQSTDIHLSTNDPKLGALADNGGPTETMLPGRPARRRRPAAALHRLT